MALDQITEGQLQFTRLEQHFDTLILGQTDERREYHIHAGKTEMAASLKKQFPGEEGAIDEFMTLMKVKREGKSLNINVGKRGLMEAAMQMAPDHILMLSR